MGDTCPATIAYRRKGIWRPFRLRLPTQGGVEGVTHAHYNEDHENEEAKNEPGRATARRVRGLRDAEGVDERRSESFKQMHAFQCTEAWRIRIRSFRRASYR